MRHYFNMSQYLFGILIWLFLPALSVAQPSLEKFTSPKIVNYHQEDYQGGTQTWDIALHNGYTFFANNNGLIVFDGTSFSLYPLPNNTIVRSVQVEGDKIYIGGQNAFGYFSPSPNGKFTYTSLIDSLTHKQRSTITDVWAIHRLGPNVFFQSDHCIVGYEEDSVVSYHYSDPVIVKSAVGAKSLWWYTSEQQLLRWQANQIIEVASFKGRHTLTPTFIHAFTTDSLLIGTLYNGFYQLVNEQLKVWTCEVKNLQDYNVYKATITGDRLYVGTSRSGIYVLSMSGKVIEHFSTDNGLQNNNVLSLEVDSFGNLWLGLDRGIDFIPERYPYFTFVPDGKLAGTGYSAYRFKHQFYWGTNNGLYTTTPSSIRFVPGSQGQVWSIKAIDSHLYVSHHRGLYQWQDDSLVRISPSSGSWLIHPINGTDYVLEGTYEGLNIYQRQPGGLTFKAHLEGFEESSRYVAISDDYIWVAHPYKGLYRLTLDDRFSIVDKATYNQEDGLGTNLRILTFQVNNEVVFTGKAGIYAYDSDRDTFVIHTDYQPFFDSTSTITYLTQGAKGHLWFVENNQVGFLEIKETNLTKEITKNLLPSLPRHLTRGFEFLLAASHYIIMPAEKGFVITDRDQIKAMQAVQPQLQVTKFMANGQRDSIIQLGYGWENKDRLRLPADYPNITIWYAINNPSWSNIVQYQYRLVGYTEEWTPWSSATQAAFNYLQPGQYTFEVRGKIMDRVTQTVALEITLTEPWYKTDIAVIGFLVFIGILFLGIALIPSIRLRSTKRKMELSKVREIRKKEQQFQTKFAQTQEEIDKLKAEKMQVEINHQAKELASTTMHLVQKGEMLSKIRDNLSNILQDIGDQHSKKEIKKIIRSIEADANIDEAWQNFEHKFDRVHVDFTKRIREQFPNLTPNDIKLCTYLKLNLTSKEIASLTNISVRGVEISRYRLRKKLQLDSHENLVEFIQQV